MGWFDEQIEARRKADEEAVEDSFLRLSGSVMGRRMTQMLHDERSRTFDAVEEILAYYHVRAREVPASKREFSEVLDYLLAPGGIMSRTVHLEKGWRKDASGAMLTSFKDGGPVALLPAGSTGYRYRDPDTGRYVRVDAKREELFADEAYVFYKPFPAKKMGIGDVIAFLWENMEKTDLIWYVILCFIVMLTGMLLPYIQDLLLSDVLSSGSVQVLLSLAAFMMTASVSALLFGVIRDLLLRRIGVRLSLSVEAASMMRVLGLPAGFFKEYASGDLANRTQMMGTLVDMLLDAFFSAGITAVFSLFYIFQIFHYAPSLAWPSFILMVVQLCITLAASFMQMRITQEQMELAAKESGMGYAMVSGIQKIRLAGAEKRAFARWGRLYAKESRLLYDPPLFLKVHPALTLAVSLAGTILLYYLAVMGGVSVSEYFAFNCAYGMMSGAFTVLADAGVIAARIRPVLKMAAPILENVPECAGEKFVPERLTGGIEMSNVTFRYSEDMPPVLDNISLKIRPGQYVALVGSTGCGKSTLMRTLLGFETPQKGSVYYDGRDLKSMDLGALRRKIGTVMQNGQLFAGDIYANIVICDPTLSLDDAWDAAEKAGVADDIRRLPMGMFTMVSEGQGGISGGQKQRLMIARAIATKPRILMFDEATSALDNLTQKTVCDTLDNLNCTRIVIAHRLSTIRHCDRILVLDHGRILEDGSFEELMEHNGFFADLVSRQQLDEGFVSTTTAY